MIYNKIKYENNMIINHEHPLTRAPQLLLEYRACCILSNKNHIKGL